MASELLHRTDNFNGATWYRNPPPEHFQPSGWSNVQSNFGKTSDWMSKRPHFLRLDSTGESADSSPEPEESLQVCQKKREANWDTGKRFHANNSSVNREVAAKSRRTTNLCHFQGNNMFHSKDSLGPVELDLLASKFNSFSTNQNPNIPVETNSQVNMSQCYMYNNQDRGPLGPHVPHGGAGYQPQNVRPVPTSAPHGPPSESQQAHNEAALSFINMSVFTPNFIHQPCQRWRQHGPFLNRPPVIPPHPMGFVNPPIYNMPHGNVPPPNFNFVPQRAPFTPFRFPQQIPHVHVNEPKHPNGSNRKKPSNRERNHPRMFTKILQRPPQKETTEKKSNVNRVPVESRNHSVVAGKSSSDVPVKSSDAKAKKEKTSKNVKLSKCSSLNGTANVEIVSKCSDSSETVLPNSSVNKQEVGKVNSDGNKQRHSTIEFMLSSLKSVDRLSDSDFLDCDWDTLDNSVEHTWDEYFLSNDPFHPLTGWLCKTGCPDPNKTENGGGKVTASSSPMTSSSSSQWSHRSQDFDSGTESGSEGETNSDSDGDWEEEGENVQTSPSDQLQSKTVPSTKAVSNKADSCKTRAEQTVQEIEKKDGDDTARRQKCLHPSISYVLGGYNAASDEDDSDDESDDWDSFDDSDEEHVSSDSSKRDQSNNLYQFSNNRFPPLSYFRRDPNSTPEVKTSPSVPCGPIFKPKARTVLISQRIICQVSDRPVSMIVPLEQNGRMSQNSMPTIQVSGQSPQKVHFPTSCLKSVCARGTKSSKKVQ